MRASARLRPLGCRTAIDLVEESYRLDGDQSSWVSALARHAAPDLDQGFGVVAYTAAMETMEMRAVGGHATTPELLAMLGRINDGAPDEVKGMFRYDTRGFYSVRGELTAHAPAVGRYWDEAVVPASGFQDGVGVSALGTGEKLTLWAPCKHVMRAAPRVKGMWSHVTTHLSAGLRLRAAIRPHRVLDEAEAVLEVDGQTQEARGPAKSRSARDALRSAVHAIERARGPLRKRDPEAALAMWRGLVQGRWSLVDCWDHDGRRLFAAHPNAPGVVDPRALRDREVSALSLVMEGASPKEVAYALGVTATNARAVLASGLRKLGLRQLGELQRLQLHGGEVFEVRLSRQTMLGVLRGAPVVESEASARLTPAEREVARLAAKGLGNAEIGEHQGTSPRTVANQMATILRKLGLRSRALLSAHFPSA